MKDKRIVILLGVSLLFLLGLFLGRFLISRSPQFSFAVQTPSEVLVSPSGETDAFALESAFQSVSRSLLPAVIEIHGKGMVRVRGLPSLFGFNFGGGDREQEWAGSGVIVLKDENFYYALTNNHVIENATALEVKVYDSSSYAKAEVKGRDPKRDLALIAFAIGDVPPDVRVAPLGDSDILEVGNIVLAIGSPLEFSFTVTQGIVSALTRSVNPRMASRNSFIQTDAAINQGNSGGPLVNLKGEVIGINAAIATPSGGNVGLGFAIPINDAKKAIERFLNGQEGGTASGWIGVLSSSTLDAAMLDSLKLVPSQKGALLMSVVEGSPAERAGLKAGDMIVSVNAQAIESGSDLTSYLSEFYVNEQVSLQIIRQGIAQTVSLTLSGRPSEGALEKQRYFPSFTVYPVTDEVKDYFRIKQSWIQGVLITSLLPSKVSGMPDLRQNDIVTHVDGKVIGKLADFYAAISEGKVSYELTLWRAGEKRESRLTR